ncbi:MAG: hypothetical protein ACOVKS_11620 [Aquimonas sp.]|jgi:hypothetical protein
MRRSTGFFLHVGGFIAMLGAGACWGEVVRVQVLDASGQPLPEAVVSVAGLGAGATVADVTLDQRQLRFVPRALAQTGWALIAKASQVVSERRARRLLGLPELRDETALSLALRRDF